HRHRGARAHGGGLKPENKNARARCPGVRDTARYFRRSVGLSVSVVLVSLVVDSVPVDVVVVVVVVVGATVVVLMAVHVEHVVASVPPVDVVVVVVGVTDVVAVEKVVVGAS